MKWTRYILFCALAVSIAAGLQAQPMPQQPTVVVMTLSPVAPARPALRNRLMPFVGDQIPGNAAQLYLLAIVQLGSIDGHKADMEKAGQMQDTPLEKLNCSEAAALLGKYTGAMSQIEQASLRESCEWGLPFREQGIRTLLPQLQDMRFLSMLIALQARVDVAAGRHDRAIHWLRVGYTMARHLNSQAVLVQGLVAAAVVGQVNKAMRDFVQSPGAANMYWPLMSLPQPLLDIEKMLEWERAWVYFTCPALKEVRASAMTPQQWQHLIGQIGWIHNAGPGMAENPIAGPVYGALMGMQAFPGAREYVLKHGYTKEQLELMPVSQVLGIYFIDSYEGWCDETFKWASVPYWQARPHLLKIEQEFLRDRDLLNPFLNLLPALSGAFGSLAAMDRDFAALRTIEAIRAYAATHEGRLPESLDDMLDPAESLDSFTGKPFEWKSDGGAGVLTAPTVAEDRRGRGTRYEITIRK